MSGTGRRDWLCSIDDGEGGATRRGGRHRHGFFPPHRASAGPPVPAVGYGASQRGRLAARVKKRDLAARPQLAAAGAGGARPILSRLCGAGMDADAIVMHGLIWRSMGVTKKTRGPSATQPEVLLWVSSSASAPCLQLLEFPSSFRRLHWRTPQRCGGWLGGQSRHL